MLLALVFLVIFVSSQHLQVQKDGVMSNMFIESSLANFGTFDYNANITGQLFVMNYTRGCQITNTSVVGKVVLVNRDMDCSFASKVRKLQAIGAVGVVVENSKLEGLIVMEDDDSD